MPPVPEKLLLEENKEEIPKHDSRLGLSKELFKSQFKGLTNSCYHVLGESAAALQHVARAPFRRRRGLRHVSHEIEGILE